MCSRRNGKKQNCPASYNYDGFLRWAYDAWPADPVRDARHTLWPAGDCFLIYPGGGSSIRFERLREGIADYEKIRILRAVAATTNDKRNQKLIGDFEAHLRSISRERNHSRRDYSAAHITSFLKKGKEMLHRLSDELPH